MRTGARGKGIVLGVYDEDEYPEDLTVKYRNRTAKPYRDLTTED